MQSKESEKSDDAKAKHVEKEPEAPPPPRVLKHIVAMAVHHGSLYVSDGDMIYVQIGKKFQPVDLEIADA
jgi:hypothetical protein